MLRFVSPRWGGRFESCAMGLEGLECGFSADSDLRVLGSPSSLPLRPKPGSLSGCTRPIELPQVGTSFPRQVLFCQKPASVAFRLSHGIRTKAGRPHPAVYSPVMSSSFWIRTLCSSLARRMQLALVSEKKLPNSVLEEGEFWDLVMRSFSFLFKFQLTVYVILV